MKLKIILLAILLPCMPTILFAQSGIANDLNGLQRVLDTIYDQMLPLCSSLIGVGQGIAGFAAIWYISVRVWRHIANAEPVDFYPLFRPFVLGFAILVFPSVIGLMNSILKPTVTATSSMVSDSDQAIALLLKQKEAAVQNSTFYQMFVGPSGSGDQDKWEQYSGAADDGVLSGISNSIKFEMAKASYNFRNAIKEWLSEILQLFYAAASLCINTIRTFYLIVLAILGPLVFGIAVFDGLHHTLSVWIARYINIFLWLPVAIRALEDTSIFYIDFNELEYIYNNFIEFNFIGRVLTIKYLKIWTQQLFAIRMKSAEDRYEWMLENHSELLLRVPAKLIASHLDITPETLSVVKNNLQIKHMNKAKKS